MYISTFNLGIVLKNLQNKHFCFNTKLNIMLTLYRTFHSSFGFDLLLKSADKYTHVYAFTKEKLLFQEFKCIFVSCTIWISFPAPYAYEMLLIIRKTRSHENVGKSINIPGRGLSTWWSKHGIELVMSHL